MNNIPFFNTLSGAYKAFSKVQNPEDEEVKKAAEIILSIQHRGERLNFRKKPKQHSYIVTETKHILREYGQELNETQLAELVKYIQALEEIKKGRRLFWMQSIVTAVIVIFALSLLLWKGGELSCEQQNVLIGLLSTVFGY